MKAPPNEEEMQAARLDVIEMLAAAWVSRWDRGLTPEEAVEFIDWRAADARHEAAVVDLCAMWSALDDLSALPGRAQKVSVVEEMKREPVRRRAWLRWTLAAAAAGAARIASLILCCGGRVHSKRST